MHIEIETNPNCSGNDLFVFQELDEARRVQGLRVMPDGQAAELDVIGVDRHGRWMPAKVQKVSDSGAGFGFLVFGGLWGIRLRRKEHAAESWSLSNPHQWGEPYMVCAGEEDIICA